MLILSNCLTDKVDEGCLKVANSLVKRIVEANPDTCVVSYERKPKLQSVHLDLNKLLVSKELYKLIKEKNEPVLYIPFPAKEWATAVRVFLLSLFCRKRLTIVLTMLCRCNFFGRLLLKMSGVHIAAFSEEAKELYEKAVGAKRVKYLKTGVDTERFSPAVDDRQRVLKEKYGFDTDRPIILHVGHLKSGRGIAELLKLDEKYQVVLVVSTLTKDERDEKLKEELQSRPNIKILDGYLPNIEEIYQLADVYFFPVVAEGNCIDVPLSCLEAAACNKPVITTRFGEIAAFSGKDGFWFIDSFDREKLNETVKSALEAQDVDTRAAVLEYDWKNAVSYLESVN